MSVEVAALQMNSSTDVAANLRQAEHLIAALMQQAPQTKLIVLPEYFVQMGASDMAKLALAETDAIVPDAQHPLQQWLSVTARRYQVWLVGGTLPIRATTTKLFSSCLVVDSQGQRVARYDKIHLFDVNIDAQHGHERYCESALFQAGHSAIVVDTPAGRLGLAICYDLRFPELFRRLVEQGMQILALPSAFTKTTGQAHWQPLLQARAIENQVYVIASAQTGEHGSTENSRSTYGHSMIIDAWGQTMSRCTDQPGFIHAALDLQHQQHLRQQFPVLNHRRLSTL